MIKQTIRSLIAQMLDGLIIVLIAVGFFIILGQYGLINASTVRTAASMVVGAMIVLLSLKMTPHLPIRVPLKIFILISVIIILIIT